MDKVHRDFLTSRLVIISQNLDVFPVLVYLLSQYIISEEMFQSVQSVNTLQKQSIKLLMLIFRRGPTAFGSFMKAVELFSPKLYFLLIKKDNDRDLIQKAINDSQES